jgi:hypothetical protein
MPAAEGRRRLIGNRGVARELRGVVSCLHTFAIRGGLPMPRTRPAGWWEGSVHAAGCLQQVQARSKSRHAPPPVGLPSPRRLWLRDGRDRRWCDHCARDAHARRPHGAMGLNLVRAVGSRARASPGVTDGLRTGLQSVGPTRAINFNDQYGTE